MTHFGIICPAATGHLNPMLSLAKELQQRGHQITVFGTPIIQRTVQAVGFGFRLVGETEFSPERAAKFYAQLGELSGLAAVKYTMNGIAKRASVNMRDMPQAAKEEGVEALLIDQICFEGSTIAEYLNVPFITVCNAMLINQEASVPPWFTYWNYNSTLLGRLRNQVGYSLFHRLRRPVREVIFEYRQKWNLSTYSSKEDYYSKIATVSQQPAEFDFPREQLPQSFHFTSCFINSKTRQTVDFPFEKLNGKPLIYASMGTLQNRLQYVFEYIAEACAPLDAQLVISLGGSAEPEALPKLPGEPLVVKYAPQLELLPKASLVITHAGLNTTLESLNNGVPMVAIPVTNDQPGVAARIAWTGAGEMIPLKSLSVPKLQAAVKRVLTEDSYRNNALRLQQAIHQAGGTKKAAEIIEQAIATGQPG